MNRAQVGDTLQQVPASGEGDESSMSSAAILVCFTADTFIPHVSSTLQPKDGAWGHRTASFARPGVCTNVLYRGGNRFRETGRS